MIQVDPKDRNSAQHYLDEWRGVIFPEVYYSHIHAFFVRCLRPLEDSSGMLGHRRLSNDSDSEAIIQLIWTDYTQLIEWISPSMNQPINIPLNTVELISTDLQRDVEHGKLSFIILS
jgi:hypothetical protein